MRDIKLPADTPQTNISIDARKFFTLQDLTWFLLVMVGNGFFNIYQKIVLTFFLSQYAYGQ